jgi:hypothetical protein
VAWVFSFKLLENETGCGETQNNEALQSNGFVSGVFCRAAQPKPRFAACADSKISACAPRNGANGRQAPV